MINWIKIIVDGSILSVIASALLIVCLYVNPRIFLQDYPKELQEVVPPKTASEKRASLYWGIPYLLMLILVPFFSTLTLKPDQPAFLSLFINAFGVAQIFNLVDWLLLDWLMFCTITPKFLVILGTEGLPGYKNYGYHFRGFLIGTLLSGTYALAIASIVLLFG